MDDTTRTALLAAYDRVTPAAFRLMAERAGGQSREADGVLCVEGPGAAGIILNAAFRLDPDVPPRTFMDAAVGHFEPRAFEFALWSRDGRDEELAGSLAAAGWHRLIDLPAMVTTERLADSPVAGATIRVVGDQRDRASFAAIAAAAMADTDEERDAYLGPLQEAAFYRDGCTGVIVAVDGADASVAWSAVVNGTGIVGWVGTLAAFRRRGLGAWATAAATNAAFDLGATSVMLQASPMGLPVYARMGFETIGLEVLWAPPRAGDGSGAA